MLKKFLVSYALLCIIPFLLLSLIISSLTADIMTEELKRTARLSLDESNRTISQIISSAQRMAHRISSDPNIESALAQMQAGELEISALALQKSMRMFRSFSNEYLDVQVCGVCPAEACARFNSLIAEQESPALIVVHPPEYSEAWFSNAIDNKDQFIWSQFYNGKATVLRQSKAIYSSKGDSRILGVAVADITLGQIHSIALRLGTDRHQMYLIEGDGTLIYPYYNYDKIPEEILTAKGENDYALQDKLMLVSPILGSDWKLIKVIPMSVMASHTRSVKLTIILLALLFLLCSLGAAIYFSREISGPISNLASKMRDMRAGNLAPIDGSKYGGEIGDLYSSFDYMIDRINLQINQIYLAQIRQKDSELRALQAQINPHFLYNTLDSINWLALRYKADDISRMVCALSDMLRLSLNKGKNTILLEDEIMQVKHYITLQQMRYSDKFDVIYDVEPSLLKVRIIKMLLQPIIENAIIHGFEKREERGLISIRVAALQNGDLHFEVSNNGTLIDLTAMRHKLDPGTVDSENRRGYGIRNVNERIHTYYGPEYGIVYSIRDNLTVADFTIPSEILSDRETI